MIRRLTPFFDNLQNGGKEMNPLNPTLLVNPTALGIERTNVLLNGKRVGPDKNGELLRQPIPDDDTSMNVIVRNDWGFRGFQPAKFGNELYDLKAYDTFPAGKTQVFRKKIKVHGREGAAHIEPKDATIALARMDRRGNFLLVNVSLVRGHNGFEIETKIVHQVRFFIDVNRKRVCPELKNKAMFDFAYSFLTGHEELDPAEALAILA